jgi:methylmalonyl-CoA mutase
MLENLHKANHDKVDEMLNTIQEAAINNENLFDHLEATRFVHWAKLHQHYLK